MTNSMSLDQNLGCPSGLEPPASLDADGAAAIVDPSPFVRREAGKAHLELAVFGAKCAGCIKKIENEMNALSGMQEARLNLSTGRLSLVWREDAGFHPSETTARLQGLGYRSAPFDPAEVEAETDREGRKLLRALAVAGFAMMNVMLLSISVWAGEGEMGPQTRALMHWVSAVIAVPAALYAGRPFFTSAWQALKVGKANMDVPISLAVFLALGLSIYEFAHGGEHTYFDAAVMLLFFLLIGRYLDHRLRLKARAAARDLLAMQATAANRLHEDGTIEAVAVRSILPGDLLVLAPGDRAPTDGVVHEGASTVDMSLVTGESAPQRLSVGGALHSGVMNVSSQIIMRATKTADTSLIADLTRLIENGEQTKSRYVRLADRAAALYVPVVHSLALATFLGWYFLFDASLRVSMTNAIAVLIITCPCALGLAAPAVQVVATGRLFRAGILVKSGDALERLAEVAAFIVDKTGTLTYGRPLIANRDEIDAAIVTEAAMLARVSRHPLSRAVVAEAGAGMAADDANELAGFGVEGTINGVKARFGREEWVAGAASVSQADAGSASELIESAAFYKRGEGPLVRFVFQDRVRADARETLEALKARGVSVEILSGDAPEPTEKIAKALGLDAWRARLTPQEKIDHIRQYGENGVLCAMVGDGLNDAPALAGAHASLSPGSAADASQSAADYVYQGERLAPLVEAVDVARKARRRVLENFGFAALYNAFAVPLAAFGFVTPLIAALAMSGSSIIVTLNALRLAAPTRNAKPPANTAGAAPSLEGAA